MMRVHAFHVARDDLHRWRWADETLPESTGLQPGQALIAIEKFGFTANNISYAHLGDSMGYWKFFPAPDGWGKIPVWGFAKVVESRSESVKAGERLFGYMPMASYAVLEPRELGKTRIKDATPHRAALPPVYNEYTVVGRDPAHKPDQEGQTLILRPLFALSFFCAASLTENNALGARRILISSASSKTALGLAFLIARSRPAGVEIVGLTSPRNLAFVKRHGAYDRAVTYDAVPSLAADQPSLFVDVAGDSGLTSSIHHALQGTLIKSMRVGFTHWDAAPGASALPGPKPELFFTPDHIIKVRKDWGPAVLGARLDEAWQSFLAYTAPWLAIEPVSGRDAIERVYQDALDGNIPSEKAYVLSFAPG